MPSIPDPFTYPEIWERLVLIAPHTAADRVLLDSIRNWQRLDGVGSDPITNGNLVIPGVVNINVKSGIRESRQDAPGENGSRATYLGWREADIVINIALYNESEFTKLQMALGWLIAPRGKKDRPKVCDAVHPQLALFAVRSIYITNFEVEDYMPLTGFRMTINAREFFEPAFKIVKPPPNTNDKNNKNKPDTKNKPKSPAGPSKSAAEKGLINGSTTVKDGRTLQQIIDQAKKDLQPPPPKPK